MIKNVKFELQRMKSKSFQGHPVGTVSFYGPTDHFATKVSAAIVDKNNEVIALERWFSEDADIRGRVDITEQILQFLKSHHIKSLAMPDRIIGCPHEEGIDYPEGSSCPECPFWKNRDRWSGNRLK